jgi:hypothetical protein
MMKTIRRSFSILLLGIIFLQTACSSQNAIEPTIAITSTKSLVPPDQTATPAPTSTPTLLASLTPMPPIDSTQQTWQSTAVAIRKTENAITQQAVNDRETQIAEFSITCEDTSSNSTNVSPDGNWITASCGYKRDQTLIVQNTNGTKWVLDFKDFLSSETPEEIMGLLHPKFWDPASNYLFFTTELGYDGGGDYCFPQNRGDYGLFRLNVKNGEWATLIPATDSFPGYEIEFSPTGRRYAITLDGVMITDLQTGKISKIETNAVVERMVWSPDGTYLAYSLANCDEQNILSSTTYIWDASTNRVQVILETKGKMLSPESWIDNSTLRIIGKEISGLDWIYTVYDYDIAQRDLIFTGTTTPNP